MARIDENLTIGGHLSASTMTIPANGVATAAIQDDAVTRAKLAQDALSPFGIKLTDLRIWDAIQTPLTGTAGTDDLALIGTAFGSANSAPSVQTSDAKNTTVTQRARFMVPLPAEYDAAETVQLRIKAGMVTTVANGTATVDVEVYESGKNRSIGSDLCQTAAQSINSLTFANCDFTINAADLVAGDMLDVRVTIAITDSGTGTAVIGCIGGIDLLADIRG